MIGTIKYIANMPDCQYQRGDFEDFISWLWNQKYVQFDIETNITPWWNTRVLISMQFGSVGWSGERVQWFIQWSELNDEQKAQIKEYLEHQYYTKLIHNATYEYVVCRFYDIIIENVYDTSLGEKVLTGGIESGDYALADISWKYLGIIMDKSEQSNFGDNIITPKKVLYGITDVAYLDVVRIKQLQQAQLDGLMNVMGLEMETVLAFGDITYHGMKFDHDKWRENIKLAEPLVEEATKKINAWLFKEPLYSHAVAKGYIADTDRVMINFQSHQQKAELLQLIFPDLIGSSKIILTKYLRNNGPFLGPDKMEILDGILSKDYKPLQDYLITNYREWLVEKEYLIPAGKVTLNWGSRDQVLPLFQLLIPKITGVGEEERSKFAHPILNDYESYKDAAGLVTRYGEEWIEKYVGPDGYVRTNFNQVLTTGRVSSSNPNMQNIQVTEAVGTRYRNCFIAEPGWEFVDSDYTGQELAIIAELSQDPVWLGAIKRGEDIHSIVAELMFADKWKAGIEPGCKFASHKQKCNCKKHKAFRYDSKAIDFGLAYGMSEIKLARDLGISRNEALNLLNTFFRIFPNIKSTLDFLGHFGVRHGYIMTMHPFNRKRWFPYWSQYRDYIDVFIQGIKYIPTLGEIERASKNQPVQGSAADMVKVAMVMIRAYIRDNDLWNTVRMVAQVHDQVTTIARSEYADTWLPVFDNLMNEAAKLIIPSGILKAETLKNPVWTK